MSGFDYPRKLIKISGPPHQNGDKIQLKEINNYKTEIIS